ncbi:MAG: hypothetical protein V4717_12795 [Bacteroidota bacterium]
MKTVTFWKLWILIIPAIQLACSNEKNPIVKQEPPPVTLPNMLECHRTTTWDSLSVDNKLIGKWQWEYIQCYWSPEKGNSKDFKGLSVTFKADNTLEVKVNEVTTQTATWEVVKLNDGNYSLKMNPLVLQLPGRILFCTDRVLFNDSYVDGCDNYFKREF